MVITMLKSVVDCSPILFVKMGQDAVGAIDFQMRPAIKEMSLLDGNINRYATDPFNNPYKIKRDPEWPFPNVAV